MHRADHDQPQRRVVDVQEPVVPSDSLTVPRLVLGRARAAPASAVRREAAAAGQQASARRVGQLRRRARPGASARRPRLQRRRATSGVTPASPRTPSPCRRRPGRPPRRVRCVTPKSSSCGAPVSIVFIAASATAPSMQPPD